MLQPAILIDKTRLPEIYRLRVLAWEHSERSAIINSTKFPEGWSDELDATASHFIVEDGGQIIAAARLNILNDICLLPAIFQSAVDKQGIALTLPFAFFSRLCVHPDFRNQNLAAILDKARINYIKKQQVRQAIVSTISPKAEQKIGKGWRIIGHVSKDAQLYSPPEMDEYVLIWDEADIISVWGRDLEDYKAMFGLHEEDLNRRVLSVADGPASCNAELNSTGRSIVSVDTVYALSLEAIEQKILASYKQMKAKFSERAGQFTFQNAQEAEHILAKRMAAARRFLKDYPRGKAEGRYVAAHLPNLPLGDAHFDLCLCGNLLFLFEDYFTWEMHRDSILAMLRVAKEVRIFPLYNRQGKESRYLQRTVNFFSKGNALTIEQVPYEVYKDGNRMMRIKR